MLPSTGGCAAVTEHSMLYTAKQKAERSTQFEPIESHPMPGTDAGALGLHEAVALLRRRVWLIGAIILGGTAAAAVIAFSLQEVYTASSTLVFDRKDAYLSKVEGQLEGGELDKVAIETEIDVIRSKLFIGGLVDSLGLLNDPYFNSSLRTVDDAEAASPAPELALQRERAIAKFRSKLAVKNSDTSLSMTIQISHDDPVQAATLANAVSDAYVAQSLRRKKDSIRGAIVLLRQRLAQLASQIAESERKIADHIRDNQLDVNRGPSQRVEGLRAEIKQLQGRLQLLSTQQSGNEDRSTAAQIERTEARLDKLEQELERLTIAEIRHRAMEQELVTDRDRYNRMAERLVNLDNQADMQNASARVISPAGVPSQPSFPKRKMIIAGGFAGSAMFSIMLALLFDGLITRVRSDQRTMQILDLPNLAYVPETPAGKSGRPASPPEHYIKKNPQSFFAEAVRSLFMACRRTNVDRPPQVIMLTSALPGEGKSTLAYAVAVSAAGLGHRTAVVDLDLHRCGISKAVGIERRDAWVSDYLRGECELEDTVQADPDVPGLDIIAASPGAQLPSTLLNSDRLPEMIVALRAQYDIIILDTPAALVVNDSSFLATLADASIMVIRWGQTTENALRDAAMRLRINNIPLVGTVINRVEPRTHARYGYGGAPAYYRDAERYYSN